MSFFKRKEKAPAAPTYNKEESEPVLRCSICTGEQVLCLRDRKSGALQELMLIRRPEDLQPFCEANGIEASDIRKVY